MEKDSNYLRLWGTHLRWAALCPTAWEIVFSCRVPVNYSTPPVVEETRNVHDKIAKIVEELFDGNTNAQYVGKDAVEYTIKLGDGESYITLVAKPDLYVLWNADGKLINLVVEVTTRSLAHIPREWLAAEMLGFYIRSLRPTFTLLIQFETSKIMIRTGVLPLSVALFKELKRLILNGTKRKPTLSLCYNCDLRVVCPSPLV